MPERITCHLCPLEGKCPKTLETNMAEIAKFLNAFEDSYPNEIKIASLVDNQGVLTYTTSPSDKANRRRRMQKWLSNENSTNDGFAYYLEFLLVQLLKQMISGKNLSNIEVTLTPTQLDCVHQGDGNGGDVIITQGNYPLVLIDVTIANLSKKQNFGMHYPTGSPVIQFSIRENTEGEVCHNRLSDFIKYFSIRAINQGLYLRNGKFHLPKQHLQFFKKLFRYPLLTAAERNLQKTGKNKHHPQTRNAMKEAYDLLHLIFE